MEGMNTTLYYWRREKNQEILMLLCFLGEKYGEKREKKMPKKCPNSSQKPTFSILVQSRVLGAIYSPWHTFQGTTYLQRMLG